MSLDMHGTLDSLPMSAMARYRLLDALGAAEIGPVAPTLSALAAMTGIHEAMLRQIVEAYLLLALECRPAPLNWMESSPEALVAYLLERHHGFLKLEMPRLQTLLHRLQDDTFGCGATSSYQELSELFDVFVHHLTAHLEVEENTIFSGILAGGSEDNIEILRQATLIIGEEHQMISFMSQRLFELLEPLRTAPSCRELTALQEGLEALLRQLPEHVQIEEHLLDILPITGPVAVG